jgi:hypothetical protein
VRGITKAQIEVYNMPMIPIKAACCLISPLPGIANSAGLGGHIDRPIRCAECEAEYHIEYNPADCAGVPNFENLLIVGAQARVNYDHAEQFLDSGHSPIISLDTITH